MLCKNDIIHKTFIIFTLSEYWRENRTQYF